CIDRLDKQPSLQRFFKYTWGSDEFVFQTLLYNSEFKKDMVNENYRYIDWSEGKPNPKTLTITDFTLIAESNAFFARKFDQDMDP
ncbi:beta-1,6-N-acetylglucosaminyltransferase, partial [Shewanella algae]|uniref:beta-1,6-N-acetylglucosaminyltransferase n=1 Tax=Shewanella algae TaxID=38313 RepID=UPI00313C5E40